jgi:hypothetical protein
MVASMDELFTGVELDPTDCFAGDWVVGAVRLHPVSRLEAPMLDFVIKLFRMGLLAMRLLFDEVDEDDEAVDVPLLLKDNDDEV